jgi:ATP-dependent protease ClpP protease subunit
MDWYNLLPDPTTGTAHVFLRDDIGCGGKSSGDLGRELAALSPKRIELQIDSSGGSTITGLNLFEIFNRYETAVTITGKCHSAALTAAMGGRSRRILPTGKILVHSPTYYINGTLEELLGAAIELEKLKAFVLQILCERTKQPATTVFDWLARDTWFDAKDALAVGLVDAITEPLPVVPAARRLEANASAPAVASVTETESEKLFHDWLAAFGRIEVANRSKFARDLFSWATFNTDEITEP